MKSEGTIAILFCTCFVNFSSFVGRQHAMLEQSLKEVKWNERRSKPSAVMRASSPTKCCCLGSGRMLLSVIQKVDRRKREISSKNLPILLLMLLSLAYRGAPIKTSSTSKEFENRAIRPQMHPPQSMRNEPLPIVQSSINSIDEEAQKLGARVFRRKRASNATNMFDRKDPLIKSELSLREKRNCAEKAAAPPEAANYQDDPTVMGGKESLPIVQLLSRYFRLPNSSKLSQEKQKAMKEISDTLSELPRPLNVSVLITSWYPPIMKLAWVLNKLAGADTSKLNFYLNSTTEKREKFKSNHSSAQSRPEEEQQSEFDLELALGAGLKKILKSGSKEQEEADEVSEETVYSQQTSEEIKLLEELKERRFLVEKSLTCFQVTYNIVKSPFKVIEEYPPYLRSITLERLLPATEYSLHVVAVYLNGKYKRASERVQFVTPTDNESRRFKENTYRPIHRYPDEPHKELTYGLAQVRSEELTIVAIAVGFWIATICLFFNKWGKIRMLEPYQPAYRETSAAIIAAHHHPSMHNLLEGAGGGSGGHTGSCAGLGGSGPITGFPNQVKLNQAAGSSLASQVGVAGAGPAANQTINNDFQQQQQQKHSISSATNETLNGSLVKMAAPCSNADALQYSPIVAAATPASGATKKLPSLNRALLLNSRRFETMADEFPAMRQRTDTELGYLFQAKAQALAKATSLWSRQQQFRSRMASQSRLPELEMLNRNQKSSQWRLLSANSRASGGSLEAKVATVVGTNSPQHKYSVGDNKKSLDSWSVSSQQGKRLTGARDDAGGVSLLASGEALLGGRVAPNLSKLQTCRSLDRATATLRRSKRIESPPPMTLLSSQEDPQQQQQQQQLGSGQHAQVEPSASNKLRRLLFISRSNRHHHIATSISSSTLIQRDESSGQSEANLSAAFRMNSASLDNSTYARPLRHQQLAIDSAARPAHASSPLLSPAAVVRRSIPATCSSPVPTLITTEHLGPHEQEQAACVRAADPKTAGLKLNVGGNQVRHHILIEPPSPPPNLSENGTKKDDYQLRETCSIVVGADEPDNESGCEEPSGGGGAERRQSDCVEQSSCNQVPSGGPQLQDQEPMSSWDDKSQCAADLKRRQLLLSPRGFHPASWLSSDEICSQASEFFSPTCPDCRREFGSKQRRALLSSQAGSAQKHNLIQDSSDNEFSQAAQAELTSSDEPAERGNLCRDEQAKVELTQSRLASCYGGRGAGRQLVAGRCERHQSFLASSEGAARTLQRHQPQSFQSQTRTMDYSASSPPRHWARSGEEACRPLDSRPRMSSVFVASPYSRAHRDSFAMLRAVSQKKSKSAEDVAYLSSLVLQIWVRDRNPLLQSASSQQQLADRRRSSQAERRRARPKSSLTVTHLS